MIRHIFDCFNKVRICHCIGLFPVQQHYQLLRCKIVPSVECFALFFFCCAYFRYSKLKIGSVKLFDTLYNVILPLCFIKRSFKKNASYCVVLKSCHFFFCLIRYVPEVYFCLVFQNQVKRLLKTPDIKICFMLLMLLSTKFLFCLFTYQKLRCGSSISHYI